MRGLRLRTRFGAERTPPRATARGVWCRAAAPGAVQCPRGFACRVPWLSQARQWKHAARGVKGRAGTSLAAAAPLHPPERGRPARDEPPVARVEELLPPHRLLLGYAQEVVGKGLGLPVGEACGRGRGSSCAWGEGYMLLHRYRTRVCQVLAWAVSCEIVSSRAIGQKGTPSVSSDEAA